MPFPCVGFHLLTVNRYVSRASQTFPRFFLCLSPFFSCEIVFTSPINKPWVISAWRVNFQGKLREDAPTFVFPRYVALALAWRDHELEYLDWQCPTREKMREKEREREGGVGEGEKNTGCSLPEGHFGDAILFTSSMHKIHVGGRTCRTSRTKIIFLLLKIRARRRNPMRLCILKCASWKYPGLIPETRAIPSASDSTRSQRKK